MSRLAYLALTGIVLAPVSIHSTPVAAEEGPKVQEIFRAPLAGDSSKEAIVMQVAYPPGFDSPEHYHTGHVVVYVLEGAGSMDVEGHPQTATAGEAIAELPEKVMVMRNESDSEWLRFVVFQVGPAGAPVFVRTDQN